MRAKSGAFTPKVRDLIETRDGGLCAIRVAAAALARFCEYTGIPAVEAAEHWNDREWLAEQTDVARKAHRQRAIEAGA